LALAGVVSCDRTTDMPHDEMESKVGLELPSLKRTARLFWRALRLRCPNCGGGPVMRGWFKMRERCGTCGIRIERGEHDYFVGSMLFNYIVAGLLLLGALAVTVVVTWPNVPWGTLQFLGPVLIVVAVVGLFPFSKLIWLAFDLMLRPATPEELEWHRTAPDVQSSDEPPTRDT
jgi:uncharacterized protein (DUF983 family)